MNQLYTTEELANKLSVHVNTIYNWKKSGMPFKKLGSVLRFDPEEVTKWIDERQKEPVK